MGGRVLKPVSLALLTRGRALDLHASTGGSVPLELHLGGTVDEDRRGIEMETFALRYPEATWNMEEPAHLRFPANELLLDPDVNGVKTGYTSKAGRCLIASMFKDGHRLLLVGLNVKDRWEQVPRLLRHGQELLWAGSK